MQETPVSETGVSILDIKSDLSSIGIERDHLLYEVSYIDIEEKGIDDSEPIIVF